MHLKIPVAGDITYPSGFNNFTVLIQKLTNNSVIINSTHILILLDIATQNPRDKWFKLHPYNW